MVLPHHTVIIAIFAAHFRVERDTRGMASSRQMRKIRRMRKARIALAACMAFAATAGAKAAPHGEHVQSGYTRYDGVYRSSGLTLYLSEHRAKIKGMAGTLELQFAGIVPDFKDGEINGARAYRITNAKEFFERNKSVIARIVWQPGKPAAYYVHLPYCDKLVSFITVGELGPFPAEFHAPADSIHVAMIDVDKFEDIAPRDICAADTYVRH